MILYIRTDKKEAELYLYDGVDLVDQVIWHAHRELSVQLLSKIDDLLNANGINKVQLIGLAVFKGPGSFTGLRIGISVANAMADALVIPIVGALGDNWIKDAAARLLANQNDMLVLPEYGGEANITQPRK